MKSTSQWAMFCRGNKAGRGRFAAGGRRRNFKREKDSELLRVVAGRKTRKFNRLGRLIGVSF